jgi:catechol 2,3-dioxygenase-like lactoylglutathione lyase family enzyme
MDAMVAQLRSAGISVELDPQVYPNGRFARFFDPEGNPIELVARRRDAVAPAS